MALPVEDTWLRRAALAYVIAGGHALYRTHPLYRGCRLPRLLGRDLAVPSFDIVSRVDLAEVDNAVAGIGREIATRFDFKGSKCTIERKEGEIALLADDE